MGTKANRDAEVWACLVLERRAQEVHEAGTELKANRGAEAWACQVLVRWV